MIHIPTPAIKKLLAIISLIVFYSCVAQKDSATAFKDTYMETLRKWDGRYMKVTSYEDFLKGKRNKTIHKRPDTLPPLKIYVQIPSIEFDFERLKLKLSDVPDDFIYHFTKMSVDYVPQNITAYSNKIYTFIPLNSFDEVKKLFKSDIPYQDDFGGVLQYSKLMLNKKGNKALLFVRDTRHRLNSVESLYLLEKKNGKWVKVKSWGISMS